MTLNRVRNDPDGGIRLIFSSKAATQGGVVRRNAGWVAREVGEARLAAEVRRRGFHMVRSGNQYVILCHPGGMQVIC
ncbi:MAG: N-(5'-phosphoribosyl)anthranilate isomerase [Pseudomonadota bacterium]